MGSLQAVKRKRLRLFLVIGLVLSAVFAGWSWFRPYEWGADSAAGCRVSLVQVRKDKSFYWVEMHLKLLEGEGYDLMKPARLICAGGRELEPADTTLGGDREQGVTTDLWFRFWLEGEEIEGPLRLRINEGELVVKGNEGVPRLGASGSEVFVTNRW